MPITEAMIYKKIVDRLMPEYASRQRSKDQAHTASAAVDFLTPDWSDLTPIKTMVLREAIALVCGINRRYATTIEHEVGEGDARLAIQKARDLMRYVVTQHSITSKTEVTLMRMAEWMQDAGLSLPAGFPGTQSDSSNPIVSRETRVDEQDRRLLELQDVHGGTTHLKSGKWRFTGMKLLIAAEVARGAKRATDKTIREDLIAACERRENARREHGDLKQSTTTHTAIWAPLTRKLARQIPFHSSFK